MHLKHLDHIGQLSIIHKLKKGRGVLLIHNLLIFKNSYVIFVINQAILQKIVNMELIETNMKILKQVG